MFVHTFIFPTPSLQQTGFPLESNIRSSLVSIVLDLLYSRRCFVSIVVVNAAASVLSLDDSTLMFLRFSISSFGAKEYLFLSEANPAESEECGDNRPPV